MGKLKNNQIGFGAVEILLVFIFLAIVAFVGVYVAHNHGSYKMAASTNSNGKTPIIAPAAHTPEEATTFTQTTYDKYLAAINGAGTDNTQPLGLVGLAAIKNNLTSDFYEQTAASHNGGSFSCATQFVPSKYTTSLASSNTTSATIAVTIANSADDSTNTTGMTVKVDLPTLKITSVNCPK